MFRLILPNSIQLLIYTREMKDGFVAGILGFKNGCFGNRRGVSHTFLQKHYAFPLEAFEKSKVGSSSDLSLSESFAESWFC